MIEANEKEFKDLSELRTPGVFCVGEFVSDELESRGWAYGEAVSVLEGDPAENEMWLELICCVPLWWSQKMKFSADEAMRLEKIFGVSAQTWININETFQAKRLLQIHRHNSFLHG